MELFWLLLLSIPFFYILGIIQFISWFRKKQSFPEVDRAEVLKRLIAELSRIKNPQRTIREQLETYTKELQELNTTPAMPEIESPHQSKSESKPTESILDEDVSSVWSRWYATNSINLLLYIGAFFIVASASIFVSFQWESISGVAKASMLTLCCLAFYGFGAWFYTLPKIRNAGATFLGIGSLLIPIVGSGWYTFVFQDYTSSPGAVWLITSLVAIIIYAVLALGLKNRFYSYLMTVSSLSIMLSFVNLNRLEDTFYVLGGIIASFLLLFVSFATRRMQSVDQKLITEPVEITSRILMPAFLLFGFTMGISDDLLFSLQGTLSVLLASLYYCILYLEKPDAIKSGASQSLLLVAFYLFGNWQDYPGVSISYSLAAVAFSYLILPSIFPKRYDEGVVSSGIGFVLLIVILFYGIAADVPALHLVLFSFFPALAGIVLTIQQKNMQLLFLPAGFSALSLFLLHSTKLLPVLGKDTSLGIIYLLIGVAVYCGAVSYRTNKLLLQTLSGITIIYCSLSVLFSISSAGYVFLTLSASTILVFLSAYLFRKEDLIYAGSLLLLGSVWALLVFMDIELMWYPFVYMGLGYFLYAVSTLIAPLYAKSLRHTGLLLGVFTPVLFGVIGNQSDVYETESVERNALITAYMGMVLVGLEVFLHNPKGLGYYLSAMGMITYLWQMYYLTAQEMLIYTLPLGLYFAVLGYVRTLKRDTNNAQLLEAVGLFFLLTPSVLSVFGDETLKHTVVLFLLGLILLGLGISLSHKLYKRAGIGALIYATFAQTYDYIYQLPRWVIVGLLGLGLIGIAIFLLLRRKEDQRN